MRTGYMGTNALRKATFGRVNTSKVVFPIPLDIYIELNQRFAEENIHGALNPLSTGDTLSASDAISVSKGTGKLLFVVNAGATLTGTMTITGTKVDRDTQVQTASFQETLSVVGVSTDNSDTDADGNTRHSFSRAYISSNWYTSTVVMSTADLALSDVDVYHCSFEQVNDQPDITLTTFDINTFTSNANAWLHAHLYCVCVSGSHVELSREASLEIPSGDGIANKYWRLRSGVIDKSLDGTTDGFFVDVFFGPSSQTYFQDFTCKLWIDVQKDLTTFLASIPPHDHATETIIPATVSATTGMTLSGGIVFADVPEQILGLGTKATPTTADLMLIEDRADGDEKKRVSINTVLKAHYSAVSSVPYRDGSGAITSRALATDVLLGSNNGQNVVTYASTAGSMMARRVADGNHSFLTNDDVRNELQIGFVLWGEENAALGDGLYEWSWGNGGVPGAGEGFVAPYAGKVIGMGLFTNTSSSATVVLEASTASTVGTVATSGAISGTMTGGTSTFSAGELLTFKTITAGGASTGPNIVNAFIVFNI